MTALSLVTTYPDDRQDSHSDQGNELVSSLLAYYHAASETTKSEGRSWYADQREIVRELAQSYSLSLSVVAAVVSALSPMTKWEQNIAGAVRLIHAWRNDEQIPDNATLFRSNATKAWAILSGDITPADAFKGGPKTRAFWRNLSGDESHATVDTWMIRAAGVHTEWTSTDGKVTQKEYRAIAHAIIAAASAVGETVAQFQAIVWLQIRDHHDTRVAA
jgi:hypothetical protein